MAHTHDVIVIGAGSAGLTAAGGCAMWGLKVALVERGPMGGECLNTGCVPSKALLAAALAAQAVRGAERFGVHASEPRIDWAGVKAHVRAAIGAIARHDSRERFEEMGVEVIAGEARFAGRRALDVAGRRLSAPRIVIAAGSTSRVPALPGLGEVPFLTSETLWDLPERPRHLVILGGGGVGTEMAQALRRLGAEVTLASRGHLLPHEDEDAGRVVADRLRAEGVRLIEHVEAKVVERTDAGIAMTLTSGERVEGSHLLIATGRVVDLHALYPEAAGVAWDEKGVTVDARRRTANRAVFAIGGCRVGPRFTHVAGHEGSIAALNIALGWPARAEKRVVPRATYTDPELAQVGLTETAARECHVRVRVEITPFADDDRAVCEGDPAGFVKAVWAGRRLVGATIVGRGAGDLLLPWTLLLKGKASPFALADTIVAYPTRSERSKQAAFQHLTPLLFSTLPRRWAALLAWVRRRS